MKEKRKCPCWYWLKGLHDAKILEASMQDDTLVLRIDSRNAMYDNFVEQTVFLDARLKTPLPRLTDPPVIDPPRLITCPSSVTIRKAF